jgi:hypothetical protein
MECVVEGRIHGAPSRTGRSQRRPGGAGTLPQSGVQPRSKTFRFVCLRAEAARSGSIGRGRTGKCRYLWLQIPAPLPVRIASPSAGITDPIHCAPWMK